jgi:predicted acetyltransferase
MYENCRSYACGPHERLAIENLLQLYTHDFSENWAGMDRGDVDADGRFTLNPLDSYWADASHIPLLFRIASHIVGFALLNRESHVKAPWIGTLPSSSCCESTVVARRDSRRPRGLCALRRNFGSSGRPEERVCVKVLATYHEWFS